MLNVISVALSSLNQSESSRDRSLQLSVRAEAGQETAMQVATSCSDWAQGRGSPAMTTGSLDLDQGGLSYWVLYHLRRLDDQPSSSKNPAPVEDLAAAYV